MTSVVTMRRRHENFDFDDDIPNVNLLQPTKEKKSMQLQPPWSAILVLLFLLGLFCVTLIVDSRLPTALTPADEETYPDAFIATRALHHLKLLTQLGPRVAGSYENEELAVDFLQREINFIIQAAHKNQRIEIDLQRANGSNYLAAKYAGKFFAYANLQNVIVKLYSAPKTGKNASLLINAHFDSVPTSPGASDDAINVAVMLEILRKLSKKAERPRNDIVFLFNGAEETGLQAAHGFITAHKWAPECTTVVNLEAAGHGGQLILFQSGPASPWLMDAYNAVPHPYGQVAGEEIFQSGLVPSDTDFRIFRDFGGLVGVDMAFFKQGYRYHTKFDDFEHIPAGSLQHAGANALSLVNTLANSARISNAKENPGKMVYFDVFGLFMITYSETLAVILNLGAVIVSFLLFAYGIHMSQLGHSLKTLKFISVTTAAILGGWLLAFGAIAMVAVFLDWVGYSMSWYGHPWLLFGLYVVPIVGVSPVLLQFVRACISENVKAQFAAHIVRLIWSAILLVATVFGVRSAYAFLIPVVFGNLAFVIIFASKTQQLVRKWPYIYLITLILPSMFTIYTAIINLALFVPISGRIGSDKPTELIIAGMVFIFTLLVTSPIVILIGLVRNGRILGAILAAIFLLHFITVFTPLGFPYSGDKDAPTPQRYWILHSQRVVHNETGQEIHRDYGYFMLNMDRNSPFKVANHVPDLKRARQLTKDCEKYLVCGLPLVHPKMMQIIEFSTWVPAGQPIVREAPKLTHSSHKIAPNRLQYNMEITGPDRIGAYLSPKRGYNITSISLVDKMPADDKMAMWNDRKLYFLLHLYAKEPAPFRFIVHVEIPTDYNNEKVMEIGISGIFVHDRLNQKVPHYQRFLNSFPDWADLTAWIGTFESTWI